MLSSDNHMHGTWVHRHIQTCTQNKEMQCYFLKDSLGCLSEAGPVRPYLELRGLEMKGSSLTASQWAGPWARQVWMLPRLWSLCRLCSSQPPSAQLTSYRSLDEELTSLRLNFFCEVRIKLVYPKGIQALIGMIGLNVDAHRLRPKVWAWPVLRRH